MKARSRKEKLKLHGAFFGVAEGRLLVRNPVSGTFEPVDGSFLEKARSN